MRGHWLVVETSPVASVAAAAALGLLVLSMFPSAMAVPSQSHGVSHVPPRVTGSPALARPTWQDVTPQNPPALADGSMVYDAADHYVVMFGGCVPWYCAGLSNVTWIYQNGRWTELFPAVHPTARSYASMAYDARDGYVVLFGGEHTAPSPWVGLNDTWTFSHGTWTNITKPVAPAARYAAGMVYDERNHDLVLFGGVPNGTGYSRGFNDTWTFVGGNWTRMAPLLAPFPRQVAGNMAYDARDGYVVLFGGFANVSGAGAGDTWRYRSGVWQNITARAGTAPTPRGASAMVYDAADRYLVLYAGYNGYGRGFSNDTWTFAGGKWTPRVLAPNPGIRANEQIAYDPTLHAVLLYGGTYPGFELSDLWAYNHSAGWQHLVTTIPGGRLGSSMVWDSADGYFVLFGGCSNAACTGIPFRDTWVGTPGHWTQVLTNSTSTPPGGAFPQMAYDPADGEVVLFGGMSQTTTTTVRLSGDTWTFHAGAWMNRTSALSVSPDARYRGGMAFDTTDGYVVMFGGTRTYSANATNETWSFVNQSWTNRTGSSTGSPPARYRFAMAYDALDGYVVVFGGCTVTRCPTSETWTYVAGAWVSRTGTTGHTPAARVYASMVDDPRIAGLLLFGGGTGVSAGTFHDSWRYNAGAWTPLHPATHPPSRYAAAIVYDPAARTVLLFGGDDASGSVLDDLWVYQ